MFKLSRAQIVRRYNYKINVCSYKSQNGYKYGPIVGVFLRDERSVTLSDTYLNRYYMPSTTDQARR